MSEVRSALWGSNIGWDRRFTASFTLFEKHSIEKKTYTLDT